MLKYNRDFPTFPPLPYIQQGCIWLSCIIYNYTQTQLPTFTAYNFSHSQLSSASSHHQHSVLYLFQGSPFRHPMEIYWGKGATNCGNKITSLSTFYLRLYTTNKESAERKATGKMSFANSEVLVPVAVLSAGGFISLATCFREYPIYHNDYFLMRSEGFSDFFTHWPFLSFNIIESSTLIKMWYDGAWVLYNWVTKTEFDIYELHLAVTRIIGTEFDQRMWI